MSNSIVDIIAADADLKDYLCSFTAQDSIMRQSDARRQIWLIVEGQLQLIKNNKNAEPLRLDVLGPGELVGILSYYTGQPSFFGVEAITDGRALVFSWSDLDNLETNQPKFHAFLQKQIRASFTERYQRLVRLHMQLDQVNLTLNDERRELKATIDALEKTRARLIQKEKLALIGSIVPGIAHELNNPAAALSRNADYLEAMLADLLGSDACAHLWQAGLGGSYVDTKQQRQHQQQLSERYPHLSRALLRRIANIPADQCKPPQSAATWQESDWETWLRPFEAARFIHTVRNAASRITRIVQSLRRYSRPQSETLQPVNVTHGIRDTLVILNSKLCDIEIETDLADVPAVAAIEDELNQVWTNLLVNAAEALVESPAKATHPKISVRCAMAACDSTIEIVFADNGPGIPDAIAASVFEPSFTTKAKGGDFGLGLGLSISRTIIEKHGGSKIGRAHV